LDKHHATYEALPITPQSWSFDAKASLVARVALLQRGGFLGKKAYSFLIVHEQHSAQKRVHRVPIHD